MSSYCVTIGAPSRENVTIYRSKMWEAIKWCQQNLESNQWYQYYSSEEWWKFYFHSSLDAVAFSIRFG